MMFSKECYNHGQKCIFVGYSKDTKAYKLYDPVTRKVIIIHDVQFVENESWDGTIENNVKIVSNVNHDEMAKEVVHIPHINQDVVASSIPMTPRHGSTQGMLTQFGAQDTPTSLLREQQIPSSSSSRSTSTDLVKKIMCEIYEVGTSNSFSIFELFAQIDDPLTFEEVVKEPVWA